jgi:hypothetical protein
VLELGLEGDWETYVLVHGQGTVVEDTTLGQDLEHGEPAAWRQNRAQL